MITADKKIEQRYDANLTDYSTECPKGLRKFFAYCHFTDHSWCLLSNIFASNRAEAYAIAMQTFNDCIPYMCDLSLHSDDGEN